MRKNIGIFGLCLMLTIAFPISVVANTETMLSPEEELEQLLEVNESQYHLETRGQAELISPGHELLDGKYDNGELVNGSVYYSVEDALAGVKRDKLEAKSICRAEERVSPPTGTIKGPDDKGNFSFTIHDKGRTYSFTTGKTSTWVDTQSQIYRNIKSASISNMNVTFNGVSFPLSKPLLSVIIENEEGENVYAPVNELLINLGYGVNYNVRK